MSASPLQASSKKLTIKSLWLIMLSALYFGSVLNLSLWRFVYERLTINSGLELVFALTMPLFILTCLAFIFSVLIWPYVAKPLMIILIALSSAANYLMFEYGVFIDSDMMANVFQTTSREAGDYFTAEGFLWFTLTAIFPCILLVLTKIKYARPLKELGRRLGFMLACLALVGLIAAVFYKDYVSFGRNNKQITRLINPTNYVSATIRHFQRQALAKRPFEILDARVSHMSDPARPKVFVLMVGETARAANLSLNGYERDTNPRLSKEDVINFPDVAAAGTSTAVSLPAMFSHLPREDFDVADAPYSENLLDILQKSGYRILWIDNDDGCKKVCDRAPTDFIPETKSRHCDGESCYDAVLLDKLDEFLKTVRQDAVVVLHIRGSHGPSYYKRYPEEFRRFTPTCDTAEIQDCERQAIINTYDNTILYTDYIVAEAIDILKKFPQFASGLLYISDHGESLGENNIYLHGLPYSLAPDEQIKVPMVLWLSNSLKKADGIDYASLKAAAGKPYSHDNLFHSLLGLLRVRTKLYDPALDIFTGHYENEAEKPKP